MSWAPRETVLVPVDFSDESFAAVETALELVENASHLHVIHVLPVLAATEPGVVWETSDDESRRTEVETVLSDRLDDEKFSGIHYAVGFGDPGSEVAAHAERIHADLVVLPSHGRTGLKRLLIGSVAERVIRLCHCPVLVLRT